jgi:hypothetical protein
MKHRRLRAPYGIVVTILFLALAIEPTPSDPATADRGPRRLDPYTLTELAHWAVGSTADRNEGLGAMHPWDLTAAAASSPRHFELFPRGGTTEEERRRFLRDIPFGPAMAVAAERHHVDGLLVAAIVEAESSFDAGRVSPQGAVGLMQVLPSTGEDYGARNLLDPRVNLDVGSRYLGELISEYGGNLELALAAYNAGPGTVERYGGMPPYPETKEYVKRVLTLYGRHHQTAGVGRDSIEPPSTSFGR